MGFRCGTDQDRTGDLPLFRRTLYHYAQLAYSFNYYGTVGSNRDEWVIVRKMKDIDWMDEPADQA